MIHLSYRTERVGREQDRARERKEIGQVKSERQHVAEKGLWHGS